MHYFKQTNDGGDVVSLRANTHGAEGGLDRWEEIDRAEYETLHAQIEPPPAGTFERDGVVSQETRDLIGEKFRQKGGHALGELDAIESNANVPEEVTAYLQDVFAMQYLTYVSLTGDRIESVESRFFE